jgi:UDP-N-acetylmuramyl tripeptide synthase
MKSQYRDRLLRRAWGLPPLEERVAVIADIVQRIGPAPRSPSSVTLPYTLTGLAGAAGNVSRARGGGATTLPGQVLLRQAPGALRILSQRLPQGCVLVSGTNGKTTTASMLAAILREAGQDVTHNRAGANLPSGIATALLEGPGEIGVFEVDEAWLPVVAAETDPSLIVIGNLFRDRLDGYGELDALAAAWRAMIAHRIGGKLVVNADDPTLAALAAAEEGCGAAFFGVEDRALGLAEAEQAADSVRCRGCDGVLRFDARMLSHLGHHRCDSCGARRPRPGVRADRVVLDGIAGSSFAIEIGGDRVDVQLQIPGLYNVYNALAAAGAAHSLGVGPAPISSALSAFTPVFGRGERIAAGATDLVMLLMKNPAGANELMRTLSRDAAPRFDLLVALNDGGPDGRDVSWIWDAEFEILRHRVRRVICSGSRAAEMALRLKYAEWPLGGMSVEPDIASALEQGVAAAGDRLIVLPTYTALLELYAELTGRGLTRPFWAGTSPPVGYGNPV